ncbi:MAG TPA: hypothetical protein VN959_16225 [Mycobacterium sp.]|nr:hypothetical protein [Mycobacterium sp.]
MIDFPAVVCTGSPSTLEFYDRRSPSGTQWRIECSKEQGHIVAAYSAEPTLAGGW